MFRRESWLDGGGRTFSVGHWLRNAKREDLLWCIAGGDGGRARVEWAVADLRSGGYICQRNAGHASVWRGRLAVFEPAHVFRSEIPYLFGVGNAFGTWSTQKIPGLECSSSGLPGNRHLMLRNAKAAGAPRFTIRVKEALEWWPVRIALHGSDGRETVIRSLQVAPALGGCSLPRSVEVYYNGRLYHRWTVDTSVSGYVDESAWDETRIKSVVVDDPSGDSVLKYVDLPRAAATKDGIRRRVNRARPRPTGDTKGRATGDVFETVTWVGVGLIVIGVLSWRRKS